MVRSINPQPLSMKNTKPLFCVLLAVFALASCQESGTQEEATALAQDDNTAAFITWLGDDTLAVEQFRRGAERMEATVVLRTPQTTVRRYVLDTTPDGQLQRLETSVHDSATPTDAGLLRREVITVEGDSLLIEATEEGETQTRRIAGGAEALPFLDMIHWPFEMVLTRAYASGQDSVAQPLFTGRGTQPFVVRRLSADSMTVRHPFRGTMGVRVDDEGRLVRLDASKTTRKLTVERVPPVDIEALARRFVERDAEGGSFGPLSGRGAAEATVDGATISVDYGVPSKRGRDIFGALVPWGAVWRTGANRATHLTTDRALRMGDLVVPAGEYTLFTIPEADGGLLIISRQTGQGGTSYDETQDLGRVAMTREPLPETVEDFTIRVEDTDAGGDLKLMWDQTAFVVPFTVE